MKLQQRNLQRQWERQLRLRFLEKAVRYATFAGSKKGKEKKSDYVTNVENLFVNNIKSIVVQNV